MSLRQFDLLGFSANHEGNCTIVSSPPKHYESTAELAGFGQREQTGIVLEIGASVHVQQEINGLPLDGPGVMPNAQGGHTSFASINGAVAQAPPTWLTSIRR